MSRYVGEGCAIIVLRNGLPEQGGERRFGQIVGGRPMRGTCRDLEAMAGVDDCLGVESPWQCLPPSSSLSAICDFVKDRHQVPGN